MLVPQLRCRGQRTRFSPSTMLILGTNSVVRLGSKSLLSTEPSLQPIDMRFSMNK